MKNIIYIFIILIIYSSQLVFANNERICKIVNNDYNVCTESNVLVSVSEWSENNQIKKFNKSLEIDARGISSITPNAFKNLKITELDIIFNGATINLEPESFDGLRWLKKLRFAYGNITLKKNLFKSIKSLNSLSLPINQSRQELSETLNDFDNLKFLEIDNCNLGEINSYYFGTTYSTITNLTLTRNTIKKIESNAFKNLIELKILKINYNHGFNSISPRTFDGLKKLEHLEIIWNENLSHISSYAFSGLNYLKLLRLDYNKINQIDYYAFAEIDQSIELLSLTFNELKSIKSKSFGELNTTVLYLSNNLIDNIEDGAFENSHIGDIYLFYNFNITVDKDAWKIPKSTNVFQRNIDQSN